MTPTQHTPQRRALHIHIASETKKRRKWNDRYTYKRNKCATWTMLCFRRQLQAYGVDFFPWNVINTNNKRSALNFTQSVMLAIYSLFLCCFMPIVLHRILVLIFELICRQTITIDLTYVNAAFVQKFIAMVQWNCRNGVTEKHLFKWKTHT